MIEQHGSSLDRDSGSSDRQKTKPVVTVTTNATKSRAGIPQRKKTTAKPPLRYPKSPIYLLVFYLPLLLLPWIISCILSKRPIGAPSYLDQQGSLDHKTVELIPKWTEAMRILNSIATLITIPTISALLARAAVVYCQRRSENQKLSLRQMFSLADRGWMNVRIPFYSSGSQDEGTGSPFLCLGLLLLVISK